MTAGLDDPAARVAELLAHPGVTEHVHLAGRFGFLAFHGGLEAGTETVAAEAAERSGASWYALVQPPDLRVHLPSQVIGAGASPALIGFLGHVDAVVAIHGYGRVDRPRELLLGGRNRTVAARLAAALRSHLPGWVIVDDLGAIPREMHGLHPDNPVNRCRDAGVQLELPPLVRGTRPRPPAGQRPMPEPGLVAALAEVAAAEMAVGGSAAVAGSAAVGEAAAP